MMGRDENVPFAKSLADKFNRQAQTTLMLTLPEGQVGSWSFIKNHAKGREALAGQNISTATQRKKL